MELRDRVVEQKNTLITPTGEIKPLSYLHVLASLRVLTGFLLHVFLSSTYYSFHVLSLNPPFLYSICLSLSEFKNKLIYSIISICLFAHAPCVFQSVVLLACLAT